MMCLKTILSKKVVVGIKSSQTCEYDRIYVDSPITIHLNDTSHTSYYNTQIFIYMECLRQIILITIK